MYAVIAMVVGQFFSQVLLGIIFWSLGEKIVKTADNEHYETLETAPFDEDAELQARMWNGMVRDVPDEECAFLVTQDESRRSGSLMKLRRPKPVESATSF